MQLFKNFAIVSSLTVLSRISGMTREIFVSHILGAGWISDAFVVALRFPNFFRQFFAEGAFNAAFLPQFSGILEKEGKESSITLAKNIFSFLAIVLSIFSAFIIILMPQIIHFIAPGFSKTPERLALCITLVQITFPYLIFVSLASLLSSILNAFNRFALAAAIPTTANIFMIIALISYESLNMNPVVLLSISLTLSGVAQLIILYAAVRKIGFSNLIIIPKLTQTTCRILKLMIPGSISTGVMQINLLISMMLASTLPQGSLSYLFYADRLNQLPLALFGISIGTALLPQLSKTWKLKHYQEAFVLQKSALLIALQFSIPAAIALFILAQPIIDLLFGHGQFNLNDVKQTAPALSAFAIGLPAYVISKVFTTIFFACEDTKTPVKVAISTVFINILLTIILMKFFLHVGMAAATSLSSWINILILGTILKKRNLFDFSFSIFLQIFKVILLSLFMGGVIWYINCFNYVESAYFLDAIQSISITVISGLIIYFISCYYCGLFKHIK